MKIFQAACGMLVHDSFKYADAMLSRAGKLSRALMSCV